MLFLLMSIFGQATTGETLIPGPSWELGGLKATHLCNGSAMFLNSCYLVPSRSQWRQTWKALRNVAPSVSEEGQMLHLDIRSSRGGPQFAASRDELYSLM